MNNETEIAQALNGAGCDPLSLVLVSDALLFELPADSGRGRLRDRLHTLHFLWSAQEFLFSLFSITSFNFQKYLYKKIKNVIINSFPKMNEPALMPLNSCLTCAQRKCNSLFLVSLHPCWKRSTSSQGFPLMLWLHFLLLNFFFQHSS